MSLFRKITTGFSLDTSAHSVMEYGRRKIMVIIKAWSEVLNETHLILIEAPTKDIAVARFENNVGWSRYRFQLIDSYCTEFKEDMERFFIDTDQKTSVISKKIVYTKNGSFVMKDTNISCDFNFRDRCTTIYHVCTRGVWRRQKWYFKKNRETFFEEIDRIIHANIKTTRTVRKCIRSTFGILPVDPAVLSLTDVAYVIYDRDVDYMIAQIEDFYNKYADLDIQRNINFFYCGELGDVYSLGFDNANSALVLKEASPIFI